MIEISYNNVKIKYKYNVKTRNIKLIDSYKINDKKIMMGIIKQLPLILVNRSEKSCLREWVAHNRLYKLGLYKKDCVDTDFTMNESLFRRICYWFLSL